MHNQLKNINSLEDKIKKINSNVNYIIEKFTEVDKSCASRIKTSGYDYRKKVGLLTLGEKIGDNPVGNTIDGIQSWYDRNKNTIEKVSIITLEAVGIVLTWIFLPEVAGLTGFARFAAITWKSLNVAGMFISADTIWSNANQLYDRNAKKKSSVDIQNEATNGNLRYGLIKGGFGVVGYNYAKKFEGKNDKEADYEKRCWMTGSDRVTSAICFANTAHNFYNVGKDALLIPEDSEKAAKTYDALKKLDNTSDITRVNLLKTQSQIDGIKNLRNNVDFTGGFLKKGSKGGFGQYNFYKSLETQNKLLPNLESNVQNYNSQLTDLQKQIISNEKNLKAFNNEINVCNTDLNLNKYNIPTSVYLYNREDINSGFHSEYFPGELKAMGLGDDK